MKLLFRKSRVCGVALAFAGLVLFFQNCAAPVMFNSLEANGSSNTSSNNQTPKYFFTYQSFDAYQDQMAFGSKDSKNLDGGTQVLCKGNYAQSTSLDQAAYLDSRKTDGMIVKYFNDGKNIAVVSRVYEVGIDINSRKYYVWFLDQNCQKVSGPFIVQGDREYRSIASYGDTVILAVRDKVNYGKVELNIFKNFSLYKTIDYFNDTSCSNDLMLTSLDNGNFLFSCQGGQNDPLKISLMDSEGSMIGAIKNVDGTAGHSSFYQSYSVGFNHSGTIGVVWVSLSDLSIHLATYDTNLNLMNSVVVEDHSADSTTALDRFFGYDSFRDLDLTFEIQSRSSGEFYIPACWQDQDKARCLKLYDANGNFIKKIDLNTKLKSQAKISNDLDFREVRSQDHALYIFDGGGIRVEESDMP